MDLLAKPLPSVSAQVSANYRLVDRQLDILSGSLPSIIGVFVNPELINTHVLANYLISSLKPDRQRARREILLFDDCEEWVRRAFDIDLFLFDLRVAVLHFMERAKKEPSPQILGTPMVARINIPCFEISTDDCNIQNCSCFGDLFRPPSRQAALGGG